MSNKAIKYLEFVGNTTTHSIGDRVPASQFDETQTEHLIRNNAAVVVWASEGEEPLKHDPETEEGAIERLNREEELRRFHAADGKAPASKPAEATPAKTEDESGGKGGQVDEDTLKRRAAVLAEIKDDAEVEFSDGDRLRLKVKDGERYVQWSGANGGHARLDKMTDAKLSDLAKALQVTGEDLQLAVLEWFAENQNN